MDAETDLYYHGARYRDAKTGVWLSVDPILEAYLPLTPNNDEAREHNKKLPGMGGVFNSVNLNLYHYAGNNPVVMTDPDGKQSVHEVFRFSFARNGVTTVTEDYVRQKVQMGSMSSAGAMSGAIIEYTGVSLVLSHDDVVNALVSMKYLDPSTNYYDSILMESFSSGYKKGSTVGKVVSYVMVIGAIRKLVANGGKLMITELMKNGATKKEATEFVQGAMNALKPSINPAKFASDIEAAGYATMKTLLESKSQIEEYQKTKSVNKK